MSKFSGKSDFADFVLMHNKPENVLNSCKIYLGWNVIPFDFQKSSDFIPYYPHLIILSVIDKDGTGIVRLSQKSFVDTDEEDIVRLAMSEIQRYWRRCKRNHEEFTLDGAIKNVCWNPQAPQEYVVELINRVAEFGDKAEAIGVHTRYHDSYRQCLYDEMINNGWSEKTSTRWCFGLRGNIFESSK